MAKIRQLRFVTLLIAAAFVAGCNSPYMRWPDLYHPGTAAQQRAEAERFDPYPSPDAGPEVVGGRPLGYQRPLTEEEWARRYGSPMGALQPVPVPSFPGVPIITTPVPPPGAVPAASPSLQPRSPY
jgi:hypothetical protein